MIALICSDLDAAHSSLFDDGIHYVSEKRLYQVEFGMLRIEKPHIKCIGTRNLTKQIDCSIGDVGRGDSTASCGDFGKSSTFHSGKGGAKAEEPIGLRASLLGQTQRTTRAVFPACTQCQIKRHHRLA